MSEEKEKRPLIWIMAGESSGDLYGARIATELKRLNPDCVVRGMGGVKMKAAGVDIMVDSTELGVIGIVEILGSIFKFIRIMLFCVSEAKKQRPDAVLMVDYPGFNIRLAKRLWKIGIPVIWYISPQVWAWRKSNIPKYAKFCRKMLVIFPFEPEVWKDSGLAVEFTGHPLLEVVRERTDKSIVRDPNRFLILPGSRKSETSRLLFPFLETASILKQRHPDMTFAVSAPRERSYNDILRYLADFKRKRPDIDLPELEITCGETAVWMQKAVAGLAASGTVTVESAIADLPLVVAYRLHPVTFQLARWIIRKLFRGYFTMPNIILDKCVFQEYLQFQVVPNDLADAVDRILPGGSRHDEVKADMQAMREALSCGSENATARAAAAILEVIAENTPQS